MALVALSLTVLTGWTGQLSLGQFALVGLGGMSTYSLVQHRVAFPVAMVLAVLITAAAALLVGAPALRMRGLFLAVTTLALAVAAPWLLARPIFLDEDHLSPLLRRPTIGGVSLESQRAYYYFCLGILVLAIVVVARVRRSGLGRSLLAVRDNELAAAAVGISPARTKLFAFGLSGALAGLAGSALVGLLEQFTPDGFLATDSLIIVAIAVVGGLASITGAILGALFVVGLPAFFPDSPQVALLTSGAGVLILLLYFPGGFIQILFNLRDLALARAGGPTARGRRAPPARGGGDQAAPWPWPSAPAVPADLDHALRARGVRVRFGHRVVVDDVDLEVAPGEVVGLIGANGAGKSTFMNAIGGYLPSDGVIEVAGHGGAGHEPRASCSSRPRPHVPGRGALRRPHRARDGAGRAGGPRPSPVRHRGPRPASRQADRASQAGPRRRHPRPPGPRSLRARASSASSPPACGASWSWRASSPPTPACSASTSPPPASPSARPSPSARSCCRSGPSSAPRCS